MNNYQNEIQKLVEGFVTALSEIWRQQAIDTLSGGIGSRAPGRAATLSSGRGRDRGAKRTQEALDQLAENFVEFVSKHPGMRIEQINKQLGTTTKDLALPIRKLLSDGTIKSKGNKRSTMYFPGKSKG